MCQSAPQPSRHVAADHCPGRPKRTSALKKNVRFCLKRMSPALEKLSFTEMVLDVTCFCWLVLFGCLSCVTWKDVVRCCTKLKELIDMTHVFSS